MIEKEECVTSLNCFDCVLKIYDKLKNELID